MSLARHSMLRDEKSLSRDQKKEKEKAFVDNPLPGKSIFGIHNPKGSSHLTQLRVGLSKLKFHKFKHNFRGTVNPMCPTSDGIEDTEHFLLLCPSCDVQYGQSSKLPISLMML